MVKEVQEEAGLKVKVSRLLAVLDKKCHPHPLDLYYVYKLFFLCEEIGGELQVGMETSDVGFFGIDELPDLSTGRITKDQLIRMFHRIDQQGETLFD